MEINETEAELVAETEKWLLKAREKRSKIKVTEKNGSYVRNIDAYISDTEHFLRKKDLVRAFEAIVWAWSWMEILSELGIVDSEA